MKLNVYKDGNLVSEFETDQKRLVKNSDGVSYYIGRSKKNHIILDTPLVSREHFQINQKSNHFSIKKLSENGDLKLNGNLVKESQVREGDVIELGPYTINIIALDGDAPTQNTNELASEPLKSSEGLPKSSESEGVVALEEKDSSDFSQDESLENSETLPDNSEENSENHDEGNIEKKEEANSFGDSSNEGDFSKDLENEGHDGFENNELIESDVENSYNDDAGDDGTAFIDTFAQYELAIEGPNASYEKYKIFDDETFIGRDAGKCQICLTEIEVSSIHAVLKKVKSKFFLEDMNSANGTILNGHKINKSELHPGDEFIIGTTTFVFQVLSLLIDTEQDRLMPVATKQEVEVHEEVEEEISFSDDGENLSDEPSGSSRKKGSLLDLLKDPTKKKNIIRGAIGIVLLFLLLSDDEKPEKSKTGEGKSKDELSEFRNKKSLEEGKPGGQERTALVRNFSKEELEILEGSFQLGLEYFNKGDINNAQLELDKVHAIAPDGYKSSKTLGDAVEEAYKQFAEIEDKKRKEHDEKILRAELSKLTKKAKDAIAEKKMELASSIISKILEKDPEWPEVTLLKMEIELYNKKIERDLIEVARVKSERKRMIDQLASGKNFYLRKEWYKAIIKLEKFLTIQDIDEDLIKEGTLMLETSRKNLSGKINPLLSKAKSLHEGQDMKGAYENYTKILKFDPGNDLALKMVNQIKDDLDKKARKIYREAIISESLSLFDEAREKFQEVLQVSPLNSDYYVKAEEKLKNYFK